MVGCGALQYEITSYFLGEGGGGAAVRYEIITHRSALFCNMNSTVQCTCMYSMCRNLTCKLWGGGGCSIHTPYPLVTHKLNHLDFLGPKKF